MLTHDVEQNSPEWRELHKGIPTASSFPNMITPKTMKVSAQCESIARKCANEIFTDQVDLDSWGGNAATERGHEMEPRALALYEFANDVEVERVGFITNDENTAGASPDGLVGKEGGVEVKCLLADKHTEVFMHHHETGKIHPDFRAQTQGQIMIGGFEWVDSIFFHPVLPFLVIRNLPDPDIQEKLQEALQTVIKRRDKILEALRAPINKAA